MKISKIKTSFNRILHNEVFLRVLSVVLAVAAWFIVDAALRPDTPYLLRNVPVKIDTQSGIISRLGLNLIEGADVTVDVMVVGKRYIVGSLTERDISVTASLVNVNGPGKYDLKLNAVNVSNKDFVIQSLSSETVRVRFDKLIEKVFAVIPDVDGLAIPNGYMITDITVTPAEIIVKGPKEDIDRVQRCIIPISFTEELDTPTTIKQNIMLMDDEGNVVPTENLTLESTTAEVNIPVLKLKELELSVEFLNIPEDFPLQELYYEISNETITVAGPGPKIDNLTSLNIGYISLKTMNLDATYVFDVNIPEDFINIDNINTVEVVFDTDDMISRKFNVTNIRVVNPPARYNVSLLTKQLTSVEIIGPAEIVDTLTASDIVAEVDISNREITTGQYSVPARVFVPGRGLVWAYGDYGVVIEVREK